MWRAFVGHCRSGRVRDQQAGMARQSGELSGAARCASMIRRRWFLRTLDDLLGSTSVRRRWFGSGRWRPGPGRTDASGMRESVAAALFAPRCASWSAGRCGVITAASTGGAACARTNRPDSFPDRAESSGGAADVLLSRASTDVLLLSASLYAKVPPSQREAQPVLDALLQQPDRWLRLQTLRLAAEPDARPLCPRPPSSKPAKTPMASSAKPPNDYNPVFHVNTARSLHPHVPRGTWAL